jgi:predicted deacylase
MTGVPDYTVGGLTAQAGSQVRGRCEVDLGAAGTVSLPVAITHGREPGPVLAITAGIHGGEYVPIIGVRDFVRDLDPDSMRGTVVACLQASPVAFERRSAFVNPLDGRNLNRTFPGNPDGGPTERLAAWLWENLLSVAGYYVDCHCGDLPEVLDSFTSISPGPDTAVNDRARAMADCFDVARLIVSHLDGATVTEAAKAGIPAALVEIGGQGRWTQAEADVQRDGLRRVAALAGILPDEGGTRPRLPVFEDAADLLSDRAGLWFPEVRSGRGAAGPGSGARGRVRDDVQEIVAPVAGVLSFGLGSLAAARGRPAGLHRRPVPTARLESSGRCRGRWAVGRRRRGVGLVDVLEEQALAERAVGDAFGGGDVQQLIPGQAVRCGQGPHHVKDVGQLAGKLGRAGRDRLVGLFQQLSQQGLAVVLLVQDPGDGVRPVRLDDLRDPVADKFLVGNTHRPEFTGGRASRGND